MENSNLITLRAFAVHIFTACGAALALLALIFATGGHWAAMFLCLGLAFVVDGIDGPLARAFNVKDVLPRWSGETLDLIVDFTTYVFVPAYAIAASGLLPAALEVAAGVVVSVTGALYFADRNMKTDDNYFRGFPAMWNLATFYLYVLSPPEWLAALALLVLAALTFVPLPFVHPLRVKRLRPFNFALLSLWVVLAMVAVIDNLEPGDYVKSLLAVIAVYFLVAGLLRKPT
jgi:phosphatidylcholine synthase